MGVRGSCVLLYLCTQYHHIRSLILAVIEIFTPQKSAKATNQVWIYCFVGCLDSRLKKVMEKC